MAEEKIVTFGYAAINPNANNNTAAYDNGNTNSPLPGFRGENQLVIYNRNSGHDVTGTNGYGFEVTVQGGFNWGQVVAVGGNNSAIPFDGYVLSGHGAAADFLLNNVSVGAAVVVDTTKGIVVIKTDNDTLLTGLRYQAAKAEWCYEDAKKGLYDIDGEAVKRSLNELKTAVATAERNRYSANFKDIVQVAEEKCAEVEWRSLESKKIEGRGFWHRPYEKNIEEIRRTLDGMAADNVNMIFLETFFDGYTIYPSKTKYIKQTPKFAGVAYGEKKTDILQAFIDEAKKRNIEVHAWVENFFVGYVGDEKISPILIEKPEWACINFDGSTIAKNEGETADFYFMDPANPEVQNLLIDVYTELVQKYEIKGVQLDYIRYPVIEYGMDGGYTEYAMKAYKKRYGLPGNANVRNLVNFQTNQRGWQAEWQRWNEWRQGNITSFVHELSDKLRKVKPTILLSAAVFPDINEAKAKKMQNWVAWSDAGWIDFYTPMVYFSDETTIRQKVSQMLNSTKDNAFNYIGLAPSYMHLPAEENAKQIAAARSADAQGTALFASHNVLGKATVEDVLRGGVYRQKAFIPHTDLYKLASDLRSDILDKSNRIYIPAGKMTKDGAAQLAIDLQKVCDYINKGKLDMAILTLDNIAMLPEAYAKGGAAERIESYTKNFSNIVQIRANLFKLRGK